MLKYTLPAVAGAMLAVTAVPAFAADLYIPSVPPKYEEPKVFGGWYLRGHIGMSNQRFKGLDYEYFDEPGWPLEWLHRGSFDSAPTFGFGAGYRFNDWFRADVMAEYRGKSSFSAMDRVTEDGTSNWAINNYSGEKSELLFMTNAYADLGSYKGFVPYIGAGLGVSRITISNFIDVNETNDGGGYAGTGHKWNFAWAVHAGIGYEITERATIDLGYSYVHLGKGTTAQAYNFSPDPLDSRPNDGFKFNGIHSHDLKLGLRYHF